MTDQEKMFSSQINTISSRHVMIITKISTRGSSLDQHQTLQTKITRNVQQTVGRIMITVEIFETLKQSGSEI